MMSNRNATKKRKRRFNPLFMLVMGISLILAGSWTMQLIKIDRSMDQQLAALRQQKNLLIAENEKLRKEIEKLNTPSYVEQLAREKLGLVRKGEIIIAPKEN